MSILIPFGDDCLFLFGLICGRNIQIFGYRCCSNYVELILMGYEMPHLCEMVFLLSTCALRSLWDFVSLLLVWNWRSFMKLVSLLLLINEVRSFMTLFLNCGIRILWFDYWEDFYDVVFEEFYDFMIDLEKLKVLWSYDRFVAGRVLRFYDGLGI